MREAEAKEAEAKEREQATRTPRGNQATREGKKRLVSIVESLAILQRVAPTKHQENKTPPSKQISKHPRGGAKEPEANQRTQPKKGS
mmetsp:Transcript_12764/g.23047  ORF Transcript_12764/g.23047 Transcript_12764/m.23047 type:complete len:87 (+) Transcript_12764:465-725(+)